MPKPLLLVSSGMICDARFKWFQALGRYLDVPIWTIESPSGGPRESLMEGAYKHEVSFLVKELKEFVAFLERLLGKKMDWERLEEVQMGTKEMDRVWYEVNELRQARPGPMHSRDFWSSMSAALYGGAAEYEELTGSYRNMYDEVKYRVNNKVGGINREEKYRLIFEGLPPWHSLGFFDQLAERGWNFVTESYYHPRKPIEADLSKISDPVERYVRSRHHGLARTLEENFGPEEAAKVKEEIKRTGFSHHLAIKSVRDYQCDGAILHTLLTCRGTSAHLNLVGSQYMEVWKVPSLVIEGDIVDLTLFDPADALRKAEAFEETMDHYKKARREAGMEW
jgi:benzoyl-CoA reductase/2-hydroxyglutaryl-CoA dehydratase subunit BcrC/BadD/HgdB